VTILYRKTVAKKRGKPYFLVFRGKAGCLRFPASIAGAPIGKPGFFVRAPKNAAENTGAQAQPPQKAAHFQAKISLSG
jgi:hypothetical protein